MNSCIGCQMDCWGQHWDIEKQMWCCITDGNYLTRNSPIFDGCKARKEQDKEVVQFI